MKIIHTGDWHVGKTIRGRHRGAEHRAILDELGNYIEKENVELLLVAGDIYDTPTPSAAAEDIVYRFFHKMSALGVTSIVIAGNHDSSLRFEAISRIMALANIIMVGSYDFENPQKCIYNYISRNGEQKVSIGMIPFIFERSFVRADNIIQEEREQMTTRYSNGMAKVFQQLSKLLATDSTCIFIGHLLMHGARPGGGERRLYLGDNYAVHPATIPKNIDYFALAHVHMYQEIENSSIAYYSGSPLQMDFGEVDHEKGFLLLELTGNKLSPPKFIPLTSGTKLHSIFGTVGELEKLVESQKELQDYHLKITIKTDASTLGLSYKIKQSFPNAVDIRREFISHDKKEFVKKDNATWLPDMYKEYTHKHEKTTAILKEFTLLYEECIEKNIDH